MPATKADETIVEVLAMPATLECQNLWYVDTPFCGALCWERKMTTGTGLGYSRSVAWGGSCAPQDVVPGAVYVFDARDDAPGLPKVRAWLTAFSEESAPLTAVIAPKSYDEMTLEETGAFESAMASLWAYPLDRPSGDDDLLAYVSGLMPDIGPAPSGIVPPSKPDYSVFADYAPDAFEKAAARLLRPLAP